jgi:hypothetical protein
LAAPWVVAHTDATRKRHIETFERKKDADSRHATVKTAIAAGLAPHQRLAIVLLVALDNAAERPFDCLSGDSAELAAAELSLVPSQKGA